jgi:hypothetical protein
MIAGGAVSLEGLEQSFYLTAMASAFLWPRLITGEKKCEIELQFIAQVKVNILFRRFV